MPGLEYWGAMQPRDPQDRSLSTEEVRLLMREAVRRLVLLGCGVILVGLVFVGIVWLTS